MDAGAFLGAILPYDALIAVHGGMSVLMVMAR